MPPSLSRRDFLTFSSFSLAAMLGGRLLQARPAPGAAQTPPNLIIILFDALSARHMSLYGYPRRTTPELEAFAQESIVFHAHHAAANYTTPSTASLFTGTHLWRHGAYHNLPRPDSATQNLFHAFGADGAHTQVRPYHRLGFAQNLLADLILDQYAGALDTHLPLDTFSLTSSPIYAAANRVFAGDSLPALLATQDFLYSTRNHPGSLFFSLLDRFSAQALQAYYQHKYAAVYPYGLPYTYLNNMVYDQRQVLEGLAGVLQELPQPYLAYLHFWSPHEPYRTRQEYAGMFDDNPWMPPEKPEHQLGTFGLDYAYLQRARKRYDENIAHIDAEFGRLVETLRRSGLLDTSYLIVTADHGQMFERGLEGHGTPLLYEPLLHIPLLIHAPAQQQRQDVYNLTSNIDLLPTLLHLGGQPAASWAQGQILPGLGGTADSPCSIFAFDSKETACGEKPIYYSAAIFKDTYKLTLYNYRDYTSRSELYNLSSDPEELNDLSYTRSDLALALKTELLAALEEGNG